MATKATKTVTPNLPAVRKAKGAEVGEALDWRAEMRKAAEKTIKQEESVATGNRISTKGGKLAYHGTPLKDNRMNCIVLAALIENAYYSGPFNPDNPQSPVCFAFSEDGEGMEPHEKSHDKQSNSCAECPHNEWGSAETGRGKACKNVRRLAVLAFDGGDLKTIQDGEIAQLSVSVTSVKLWSGYAKQLAMNGQALWSVQTLVTLEREDSDTYSKLHFESSGHLPEKFYPAILKRVREAEQMLDAPYVFVEAPAPRARSAKAPAKTAKRKF